MDEINKIFEIIFKNLRSGVSINGSMNFEGGRFIPDPTSRSIIPNSNPKQEFQNINGIVISLNSKPKDQNCLQNAAMQTLEKAQSIFAAMCAKYQTYMYLDTPITFSFDGKDYIFHEQWVEDLGQFNRTGFIGGSGGFCMDLGFLKNNKNHKLIYDFYREAQNETNPVDYRVLQLWRFFEGWFNLKNNDLVKKIVSLKLYQVLKGYDIRGNELFKIKKMTKKLINGFYKYSRCAVAHGGGTKTKHSKKVIIPRIAVFDDWVIWYFHDMLEIAASILKNDIR